ncbi:MAG: gamma-glutamyl-phosphate reductase, partial [Comamonadaceae bacterium]
MNAFNVAEHMQALGLQARAAAAQMARASARAKNAALRALARRLREAGPALAQANALDLARAEAAGLAAPMVDRLRLTPKVIETVALGCEQLAAMPDVIGDIVGLKEQPSGIRVGQMRVPIGV